MQANEAYKTSARAAWAVGLISPLLTIVAGSQLKHGVHWTSGEIAILLTQLALFCVAALMRHRGLMCAIVVMAAICFLR